MSMQNGVESRYTSGCECAQEEGAMGCAPALTKLPLKLNKQNGYLVYQSSCK